MQLHMRGYADEMHFTIKHFSSKVRRCLTRGSREPVIFTAQNKLQFARWFSMVLLEVLLLSHLLLSFAILIFKELRRTVTTSDYELVRKKSCWKWNEMKAWNFIIFVFTCIAASTFLLSLFFSILDSRFSRCSIWSNFMSSFPRLSISISHVFPPSLVNAPTHGFSFSAHTTRKANWNKEVQIMLYGLLLFHCISSIC